MNEAMKIVLDSVAEDDSKNWRASDFQSAISEDGNLAKKAEDKRIADKNTRNKEAWEEGYKDRVEEADKLREDLDAAKKLYDDINKDCESVDQYSQWQDPSWMVRTDRGIEAKRSQDDKLLEALLVSSNSEEYSDYRNYV